MQNYGRAMDYDRENFEKQYNDEENTNRVLFREERQN